MKILWRSKIRKGRIIPDSLEEFKVHLAQFEGGEVDVIVEKPRKERSLPQNRFYFGVVLEIIHEETGWEKEDIHEYFKIKFLREPLNDQGMFRVKSTTELTTIEMEEYIEKIRREVAMELAIEIPLPHEVIGDND